MLRTLFLPAVAASLAIAAPRAQTIWNVGPGGLPSIPAALVVASPGDIVDISPGTYPAFDCSIGVTLRAVPGTVAIDMLSPVIGPGVSMLWSAPAGQTTTTLYHQDLRCRATTSASPPLLPGPATIRIGLPLSPASVRASSAAASPARAISGAG